MVDPLSPRNPTFLSNPTPPPFRLRGGEEIAASRVGYRPPYSSVCPEKKPLGLWKGCRLGPTSMNFLWSGLLFFLPIQDQIEAKSQDENHTFKHQPDVG